MLLEHTDLLVVFSGPASVEVLVALCWLELSVRHHRFSASKRQVEDAIVGFAEDVGSRAQRFEVALV